MLNSIGATKPLAGVKLLVVDDSPDYLDLLNIKLSLAGALVTAASCAEEAMMYASLSEFDAILTDVDMPEVDGFTLISQLWEAGSRGPFIVVTASKGFRRVPEDKVSLVAAHFGKPTDSTKLIDAVRGLLAIRDV